MQKKEISNYIVRADFYPNGAVLPLGITNSEGCSMIINRAVLIPGDPNTKMRFDCLTNNGKRLLMIFESGRWFVDDK